MDIKATTVYDYPILKGLIRFGLFKGKYRKFKFLFIILCSIITYSVCIFSYINFGLDKAIGFCTFCILLIDLIIAFIFFLLPTISYKADKKFHGMRNEYTFGDMEFTVDSLGDDYSGTCKMSYDKINKAYETDRYFYINLRNNQYFIIDKLKISDGTPLSLSTLLKKNIDTKRYIHCK